MSSGRILFSKNSMPAVESFGEAARLCVIAATVLAFAAKLLRQPLILAYIGAGLIIGPPGFKWVHDGESISQISDLGLAFLLFIVGLEIDLKHLIRFAQTLERGLFDEELVPEELTQARMGKIIKEKYGTDYYIIDPEQTLAEQIAVVMVMKGLEK